MKRSVLGLVAVAALCSSSVFAADMPVKAPPPPPPTAYNWTGWYVGGNLGGKWADAADTVNFAPSAVGAIPGGASLALPGMHDSTFIGGGQVGYNWQSGAIVYGLEASVDAQHWKTSQTLSTFSIGTLFVPGDYFSVRSNWQAAFLGRIGYAWDRTLLYLTGGLAVTNVNVSSSFVVFGVDPATAGSANQTLAGGTFGAGIEYALGNKWSLGLEGRYSWYGTNTYSTGTVALGAPTPSFDPVTQSVRLNTGEVVAKINYHF